MAWDQPRSEERVASIPELALVAPRFAQFTAYSGDTSYTKWYRLGRQQVSRAKRALTERLEFKKGFRGCQDREPGSYNDKPHNAWRTMGLPLHLVFYPPFLSISNTGQVNFMPTRPLRLRSGFSEQLVGAPSMTRPLRPHIPAAAWSLVSLAAE